MLIEKLLDNDNYVIVNKPYDMYVNHDDDKEKNTVAYIIGKHDSHLATSSQPLHFVQRLDYATSGVLCIAKNKTAAADAGRLLEKRLAQKYYLAVVRGVVQFNSCEIEYDVGEDPLTKDTNHKMIAVTDAASLACCLRPRSAHTRLLLLQTGSYDKDPASVVLLKPKTGRRHQLRVHCSALGHTILGDFTYSDARDHAPHRMHLHAMRLVLPLHEQTLDVRTEEPFFTDQEFVAKWRTDKVFHHFQTEECFQSVCDIIDKCDVDSSFKFMNLY